MILLIIPQQKPPQGGFLLPSCATDAQIWRRQHRHAKRQIRRGRAKSRSAVHLANLPHFRLRMAIINLLQKSVVGFSESVGGICCRV